MRVCPCATENPLRSAASSDGGSGKLLIDLFVDARAAEFAGHAYGVLDGVGIRAAVGDNGDYANFQKRSADGFRRVSALAKIVESLLGQSVTDLGFQQALDGLLQHALNVLHQAFTDFQRDVADETVADDYVHVAAKYVAAFHVAREIQRRLFQQVGCFASQLVTFHLFFTDGKQGHARTFHAPDRAEINFAHYRKLAKLLGLGIHVRAYVEDHRNFVLHVGEGGGERRTIHGRKRSKNETSNRHNRAGVACADHGFGLPVTHQARGHVHGAFLLAAESLRRRVAHGDDVGSADNFDGQIARAVAA